MINFGSGKLIAVPTHMADGSPILVPTPVVLGIMQEVSLDLSVDIKTLYGSGMYPVAVAQGKAKVELKAKYAEISAAVLGSLFFGQTALAGVRDTVLDNVQQIPAVAPFTIAVSPPNTGIFVSDMGVWDADTGEQFTRVDTAPQVGQYSVAANGTYTFATQDKDKAVSMNYEYRSTSNKGRIFEINNRPMGYTPSFTTYLRTSYDGRVLTAKLNRGVSGKLSLGMKAEDFTVSDFDAECFANPAGQVGWLCLQ